MAGALIVEERIVNEDSRSMVQEIIQLSKQFQEGFDPSDENSDYMLAVDAFAEAELLARYSPESAGPVIGEYNINLFLVVCITPKINTAVDAAPVILNRCLLHFADKPVLFGHPGTISRRCLRISTRYWIPMRPVLRSTSRWLSRNRIDFIFCRAPEDEAGCSILQLLHIDFCQFPIHEY